MESYVVDGFDDTVVCFEVGAEVFYLEKIAVFRIHAFRALCSAAAFMWSSSAGRARHASRRRGSLTRRASTPSSRPERPVATERWRYSEFHQPPDCPTTQAAPAHQNRETTETPPST